MDTSSPSELCRCCICCTSKISCCVILCFTWRERIAFCGKWKHFIVEQTNSKAPLFVEKKQNKMQYSGFVLAILEKWYNKPVNYSEMHIPTNKFLLRFDPWASEGFLPLGDFLEIFQGGPKVVKFVFSHSKLRKQPCFLKVSKSRGGFGLPMLPLLIPWFDLDRWQLWNRLKDCNYFIWQPSL